MTPERKIKIMPTRDILEQFLEGMSGKPKVVFNIEEGKFEPTQPTDPNLGKPKTAFGRKLREL